MLISGKIAASHGKKLRRVDNRQVLVLHDVVSDCIVMGLLDEPFGAEVDTIDAGFVRNNSAENPDGSLP
jgi:hypothetical protein